MMSFRLYIYSHIYSVEWATTEPAHMVYVDSLVVEVWSTSFNKWVKGYVVKVCPETVTVEYTIGVLVLRKLLGRQSEHIRLHGGEGVGQELLDMQELFDRQADNIKHAEEILRRIQAKHGVCERPWRLGQPDLNRGCLKC